MKDKLIAITPEKWGLLEALGDANILNMQSLKTVVQNLANTRLEVAEEYFLAAKQLLENNIHDRSVISRAYYGRYHSVRAVVYIKMRLDVPEHKKLIKKFEKVLIKAGEDAMFGRCADLWRTKRNLYEYNPLEIPDESTCFQAVEDCKTIIELCKKLIR